MEERHSEIDTKKKEEKRREKKRNRGNSAYKRKSKAKRHTDLSLTATVYWSPH